MLKPPTIPYPGAKGRLAPKLVQMMPQDGRIFLDVFAGRGNVFFAAALSLRYEKWILNDISTAPFFRCLSRTNGNIDVPDRTREEFERCKAMFQWKEPRAILLEPYLTYSGGGYKNGGFGGMRSANAAGYSETLRLAACIINRTKAQIQDSNWTELGLNKLSRKDFAFFDPPYYGADVRAYTNNFDHARMIEVLKSAEFKWMLTEYRQDFYLKAFGKPRYKQIVQLACDGRGSRYREEYVWTNY